MCTAARNPTLHQPSNATLPTTTRGTILRAHRIPLTELAISIALTLAACSSGQDQTAPQQPTATSAATAAPAATTNTLTADQVNVQMTLQGAPILSADSQPIDVAVTLADHGKTVLASTGPNPVNLGAHSADANGTVIDNNLARAGLPDIASGGQAMVTIQLPVDKRSARVRKSCRSRKMSPGSTPVAPIR